MYPTPNWLSHPVCSGSCSLSSMPHQSSLPILLSSQLHYFFPASWTPKKLKTKLFLGFAETGPNKLTVGKIFGGMLILENWKLTKFSAIPLARKHLSVNIKDCILGWPGFGIKLPVDSQVTLLHLVLWPMLTTSLFQNGDAIINIGMAAMEPDAKNANSSATATKLLVKNENLPLSERSVLFLPFPM